MGMLRGNMDLVDVRDEPAFTWCVDLLIVGPQLALDGEEQHLQIPFLCESEAETKSRSEVDHKGLKAFTLHHRNSCCFSSHKSNTFRMCESQKSLASKAKEWTLVFFFLFLGGGGLSMLTGLALNSQICLSLPLAAGIKSVHHHA